MAEPQARAVAPPASVALIGLGNMGRPMAARLAGAGFLVHGYDSSPASRARAAADRSLKVLPSLEDAVGVAEAVVTMLPNGAIVRAVVEEMRPYLKPGAVIVDMSSSDPMGTRALGEELIASGFGFVDAPVSGGVKRAVDGTLAIMAGGEAAGIDRVEPLLQAMGRSLFRTGPLGSGHAMKALNNYVSGAGLIAAIEALEVGRAFGLEPDVIVDVLNASTGRNNSTEVKLKPFVIPETYASGFFLGLMAKDIRTAERLAGALGVNAPLARNCADLWDEAARRLGEGADHTEVHRAFAEPR